METHVLQTDLNSSQVSSLVTAVAAKQPELGRWSNVALAVTSAWKYLNC